MVKERKGWSGKQIFRLALPCILLLAAVFSAYISHMLTQSLSAQMAAKRWDSSEHSFAQVSVFFGEDEAYAQNSINGFRSSMEKKLSEASISLPKENQSARLWLDAYSREDRIEVSRGKNSESVGVIGVGGDFFYFHPQKLLDGYYFQSQELMKDRVLIDGELAWKLYGSYYAAGMDIYIAGKRCVVAGVFEREQGRTAKAAYGDGSKIFVPIELLNEMNEEKGITAYEALLPNPVEGFAYRTITELVTGIDISSSELKKEEIGNVEIVENSVRFDGIELLKLIKGFGERSMKQTTIRYPYWENQARAMEVYAAVFLYLAVAFSAVPIAKSVLFLRKKGRAVRKSIPVWKEKTAVWYAQKKSAGRRKKKEKI